MKNSAFTFVVLLTSILFSNSAYAHPGHDLTAHGPAHLVTSPYHVASLLALGVTCFVLAALLRQSWARRFQLTGAVAFFSGVLLWAVQH